MFNLELAITEWRRRMTAAGTKSTGVLDELEAHLREEVEQQIRAGAAPRVAFEAAVECLGRPEALQAEFAKLETKGVRPRFPRGWYYIVPPCILFINTWTFLEYELSPLEQAAGISAVSLICLYLFCLPKLVELVPGGSHGWLAKAAKLTASLACLWPIWATLEAVHIVHLRLGIVPATILWCLYAAVLMSILAYGLRSTPRRPGGLDDRSPPFGPKGQPIPPTRPPPPEFALSPPTSRPVDAIVNQSFEAAADEANRLGHDFVGTEHVLLGLLRHASGSFANILWKMKLDCGTVRAEIEKEMSSQPYCAAPPALRLTPRARKAVALAAREAKALNHPRITAEHVFLGLLLEGGGVAAVVLGKLGTQIQRTRREIISEARAHPTC